MYKHIIFDLDGTLIYSHEGIFKSVIYALSFLGIELPNENELMKFIGPPLEYSYMNFCGLTIKQCDEAVALFRERYSDKGIRECMLIPGVYQMLRTLSKEGLKMYIATSKPREYVEIILKDLKIYDYFCYVGAEPLSSKKRDKATIIESVKKIIGNDFIGDIVMIGDRKEDVLGAKIEGVDFLGVKYGYAEKNELENAGTTKIFDTVFELQKFLLQRQER